MGKESFAEHISGEEELSIAFVSPRNGKKKSLPVWFTVDEGRVQLLPMYGLRTLWFRDVEGQGKLELVAKGEKKSVKLEIIKNPEVVDKVKSLFSRKYGDNQVKKYYPTSEVAIEIAF